MAQVREVIRGCAGLMMGEIAERVLGSVVLLGNRMGETNGLVVLAGSDWILEGNLRVVKTSRLGETINYFVSIRPWKIGGVVFRPILDILW